MTTVISNTTGALKLYPSALALLFKRPKLLIYTTIAAITTILAMWGLLILSWVVGSIVIDWMVNWLGWESIGGFIGWLLKISYSIFMLAAAFYTFPSLAGIIGLPFYDLISGEVELATTGTQQEAPFWEGMIQGLKSGFAFLAFRLMVLILGLPLFFIPFIGTILLFMINAGFVRFDYLDIPMSRRGWGFQRKWDFLKAQRQRQWTFGVTTALLLSIPLLNLLIPPLSVIAGTLLFLHMDEAEKLSKLEDSPQLSN